MSTAASLPNSGAFSSSLIRPQNRQQASASISTFNAFNSTKQRPFKPLISQSILVPNSTILRHASAVARADSSPSDSATSFHGVCYVVRDNIDTDQIIPAEYLTDALGLGPARPAQGPPLLVPSKPEEYKKLGSYALIGLPESYETRFVETGEFQSKYSIIIAGDNFGCGSSREHAPVALGAAGVVAVVAESYARIFFRNSVATGEIYPLESEVRVCEECKTGDVVTIELDKSLLINHRTEKEYSLKPIGDAGPVIEAGGIFAYARKAGMIPAN